MDATERTSANRGNNVRVEDTFTYIPHHEPVERERTDEQPAQFVTPLPPNDTAGTRLLPSDTLGEASSGLNSSSVRDVGATVRKWNVRFSGERHQSIDHFLVRVKECQMSSRLSESELLSSLSELLEGVAGTWYRNNFMHWRSWEQFRQAALSWYGGNQDYQQRLHQEANARTQGPDELVRDYVTNLTALMRRLVPVPTMQQQLDRLYRNLRPEIKGMIRRDSIHDVEALRRSATEAEEILESRRVYRPPLPLEQVLLPELAYKPPTRGGVGQQHKKSVAAVSAPTASTGITLEKLFEELQKTQKQLQELKGKPATTGNSRGRSRSRRRPENATTHEAANGNPPSTQGNPAKKESTTEWLARQQCYHCKALGHFSRECPTKQGNAKGGTT